MEELGTTGSEAIFHDVDIGGGGIHFCPWLQFLAHNLVADCILFARIYTLMAALVVEGVELGAEAVEAALPEIEAVGSEVVESAEKVGQKATGLASRIAQRVKGTLGIGKTAVSAAAPVEGRTMQRIGDVALGVGLAQSFGPGDAIPDPTMPPSSTTPPGATGGACGKPSIALAIMIVLIIIMICLAIGFWKEGRPVLSGFLAAAAMAGSVWSYSDFSRRSYSLLRSE